MNHLGLVLVKTTETLASLHTEADLRYHVEVDLHTEAGGEGRVETLVRETLWFRTV